MLLYITTNQASIFVFCLADLNWCKFTLIIEILFFTITMPPECRRCGECYRWVVLQNIQPNSDDIEYYTCRGGSIIPSLKMYGFKISVRIFNQITPAKFMKKDHDCA